MSNHDKDIDFENYLSGNSDLSDLYHDADFSKYNDGLAGDDIDNSILAAAKREVNSKPKSNVSPFSNSYLISLSTAASILILFAVVSFFPEEQTIDIETGFVSEKIAPELKTKNELKQRKSDNIKIQLLSTEIKQKEKQDLAKREKLKTKNSNLVKSIENKDKKLALKSVDLTNEGATTQHYSDVLDTISVQPSSINSERKAVVFNGLSDEIVSAQDSPIEESLQQTLSGAESISAVNNDLVYDEKNWKNLTPGEWRRRIKEIYNEYGMKETEIVIRHFNIKFPKLKLTTEDIIQDKKLD